MVKIAKVAPTPSGSFSSAFCLPITRDGRVLLTKEQRGTEVKYGMLGGKPHEGETDFQTMAREADEETGGALSKTTLTRLANGCGIIDGAKVVYEGAKSVALKHDLVIPVDFDVDTRFDPRKAAAMASDQPTQSTQSTQSTQPIQKKKRKKAKTVQLGLEFVPLDQVRDWQWRGANMDHNSSVLCSRLMKLGD